MDEQRLNGNAAAGLLREVFSFETTTAEYACGSCESTGALGGAMVYEVRDMGLVVRCPGCDNALIRLAQSRGQSFADFRETKYLTVS